jgi:hypothetical protein
MCLIARRSIFAFLICVSMSLPAISIFAQAGGQSEAAVTSDALPRASEAQTKSAGGQVTGAVAGRDELDDSHPPADQHPQDAEGSGAFISGTVTDTNGNIVPGAAVTLDCEHPQDRRTVAASDTGAFQFDAIRPGAACRIKIEARDLENWSSEPIVLSPGQYFFLKDIELKVPNLVTSVTVYATQEQIAAEQVEIETKQRVFGFIPNFYVTYDEHPVPLTTKLKFKLALKADTDVMTFVGVAFMSAIYQAGDMPDYGQGWDAYGKRMAAGYGDTSTDIFFGGAIYPWMFRQDPRYFYQGTGTVKSRALHAMSSPYICKGDNGRTQPNYSSLGGDLTSGAISNLYYPETNRGAGLVFEGFAITTGVRTVNALIQEFLLRKLTPSARQKN